MCPGCAPRDSTLASRLQDELDDLRDEVVYLKVKLRKEGTVNRTDYTDVRDRLQDAPLARPRRRRSASTAPSGRQDDRGVGGGVSGGTSSGVGSGTGAGSGSGSGTSDDRRPRDDDRRPTSSTGRSAIPAGQEIDVRLERELTLRHRAGRGSLRGDDRGRSVSRATTC